MRKRFVMVMALCAISAAVLGCKQVVKVGTEVNVNVSPTAPSAPPFDPGPQGPNSGPGEFNVDTNNLRCDVNPPLYEHTVYFTWSPSAGATSNVVERLGGPAPTGTGWTEQRPDEYTSFNGNSFTQRRVRPDFQMSYRVWAVNAHGRRLGNPQEFVACRPTYKAACSDTRDNDGDGKADRNDPGCSYPQGFYDENDNDETDGPTTGGGTGPGPGTGTGPGTPTGPTGPTGCVNPSYTPPGGTGAKGSTFTLTKPSGCSGIFRSSAPNKVSISDDGAGIFLNLGCAVITFNNGPGATYCTT